MRDEIKKVVYRIHEIFKEKSLTLSVAESCTGGLISHYVTFLPGASKFFEAGVVVYSAEAKKNILGVSSETILKYGVISNETAKEMAERMRELTGTDFCLSTTGNLGPDVQESKDRGLVYTAVSSEAGTVSKKLMLKGDREENKEIASLMAMKLLVETVKQKIKLIN